MSNRNNFLHHMKLELVHFNKIQSGKKIIELRLFDQKRRKIKIGDLIEFTNQADPDKKLRVKVLALLNYASFSDLLNDFPAGYFGAGSKAGALNSLRQFYSTQEEAKHTVVGIKISIL